MSAITFLTNGVVIDRQLLGRMKNDAMAAALAEAYAIAGKREVIVVSTVSNFSNNDAIAKAIAENDDNLKLMLELRGITLADDDLFIIQKQKELNDRLAGLLVEAKPAYAFAKVPARFNIETSLIIGKTTVKRERNGYTIGLRAAERLWATASAYWAKTNTKSYQYLNAGGRGRTANIDAKGIKIGCQRIQRYELEQLALNQGWAFPA